MNELETYSHVGTSCIYTRQSQFSDGITPSTSALALDVPTRPMQQQLRTLDREVSFRNWTVGIPVLGDVYTDFSRGLVMEGKLTEHQTPC